MVNSMKMYFCTSKPLINADLLPLVLCKDNASGSYVFISLPYGYDYMQ